jgi:hypothetical protein
MGVVVIEAHGPGLTHSNRLKGDHEAIPVC